MKREEKKRETVNRIIDAALRLFSEKGYEATTVAEITEAAGVAKGTFFNYFKAKEELLVKFQKALFFNEIRILNDQPGPYAPRILDLVKELGDSMNDDRVQMRLALQRFLATSAGAPGGHGLMAKAESMIPLFERGQQSGEFAPGVPPAVMARTALQIYLGTLLSWSTGDENDSLGDQLVLAFRIFLKGVLT
ncbi:transcriptional regulator, TetR family [Sporobacter termitidis DSM 10068]|uniref:Transcriptional regulator, TetR family n=1 Tax=Sporobacter termitidis DSM 10068 TaxID=1123282 RepID=A0A1M5XSJ8_9FIRM|nr:TetR/AcrR family transcriptional regulator [Sporobacter termitidis]SHI02756.1 transcriptional regulator, TetR family [Sporobacter termitidis DSM 10068]